jgi:hypothetical protein
MEGDTGGLIMMAEAGVEVEAGATESDADLGRVLNILKNDDPDASQYGFLPYCKGAKP